MSGRAMGRVAAASLVATALAGGLGVWWFQTRAFYDGARPVTAVALTAGGRTAEVPARGTSIDADSSPLRYRACFALGGAAPAADAYAGAAPTVAPGWFECFDARALGADLAAGRARAVMGTPDVRYGIDRVVALYPDGAGFAWHQINRCGEAVFDGGPPPEGCAPPPPAPEG